MIFQLYFHHCRSACAPFHVRFGCAAAIPLSQRAFLDRRLWWLCRSVRPASSRHAKRGRLMILHRTRIKAPFSPTPRRAAETQAKGRNSFPALDGYKVNVPVFLAGDLSATPVWHHCVPIHGHAACRDVRPFPPVSYFRSVPRTAPLGAVGQNAPIPPPGSNRSHPARTGLADI